MPPKQKQFRPYLSEADLLHLVGILKEQPDAASQRIYHYLAVFKYKAGLGTVEVHYTTPKQDMITMLGGEPEPTSTGSIAEKQARIKAGLAATPAELLSPKDRYDQLGFIMLERDFTPEEETEFATLSQQLT